MPQLRFLDNEGVLRSLPLVAKEITVGRSAQCDVPLNDDLASREHARIKQVGDASWQVQDLQSRNRTFVNSEAIKSRVLQQGDVIRIGSRLIEFVDESSEQQMLAADVFLADREPPAGCDWLRLNEPITLAADQLRVLAVVIESIPRVESLDMMTDALLGQIVPRLKADRGFVAIRGKESKALEFVASHAMSMHVPGQSVVPVSQAFVQRCQKQNSIGYYPEGDAAVNVTEDYPPTAMVVPLFDAKRVQGVIYLDRLSNKHPFTRVEMHWLAAAAAQFSGLWIDMQQRVARLQQQATTMRLTQLRRLDRGINTVEGEPADPLRAACRRLAGRDRCGDLYHLVSLDEKRLAVIVADAGGTGTGGMVQAASVLTAVRSHLSAEGDSILAASDLGSVFDVVNRTVMSRPHCQPIAVAGMMIDLGEGRLTYVNAGYTMPLLLTGPGRLVSLDHGSLLLGVEAKTSFQQAEVDLPAKFRLFVYSDGVTDAWDKAGQCFDSERVRSALLDDESFGEPAAMIDRVIVALTEFRGETPLSDDALFIAVARD